MLIHLGSGPSSGHNQIPLQACILGSAGVFCLRPESPLRTSSLCLVILLSACSSPAPVPICGEPAFAPDVMWSEVDYLASPELDGRYPGTDGDRAARRMIRERFECLGLEPLADLDGYDQFFEDSEGNQTGNVIGFLPGNDFAVRDEIVVVSAHVDHLGDGFLGANDNASGISGLLSIAQAATEREAPRRTLVFAAFGSEELGFEGSYTMVDDPPAQIDPDNIVYNVNMDMIGSYDQTEIVYALGALPKTPAMSLLKLLVEDYPELDVGLGEPSDESDNVPFCELGIPYVFWWTEDPKCYHERCDKAGRLDYESMASIASLNFDLAWGLADSAEDLRAAVRPGVDVCGF